MHHLTLMMRCDGRDDDDDGRVAPMYVLIIGTCHRTFFVFELFSTVFVGTFALRIAQ
jgi:hypothetical protein